MTDEQKQQKAMSAMSELGRFTLGDDAPKLFIGDPSFGKKSSKEQVFKAASGQWGVMRAVTDLEDGIGTRCCCLWACHTDYPKAFGEMEKQVVALGSKSGWLAVVDNAALMLADRAMSDRIAETARDNNMGVIVGMSDDMAAKGAVVFSGRPDSVCTALIYQTKQSGDCVGVFMRMY